MATQALTIDCQVHCYERNTPARPWNGHLEGPEQVTGDDMVAAMDAVGVAGAILISPFSLYGYDPSYCVEQYNQHPTKFGLVRPFNPDSESIDEDVAEWTGTTGVVGCRVMLGAFEGNADHAGMNQIFAACARAGVPVNVMAAGKLPLLKELARRNPDTSVIIDHLGLAQPFVPPPPAEPFADLPNVLSLAELDNVVIKISGAGTLAHEPFPYPDIWEPLGRIFDAYGLDRCLWGTDWTRAVRLLTYEQGVEAFRVNQRLSDSDRSTLMGGTLARVYNWSPS